MGGVPRTWIRTAALEGCVPGGVTRRLRSPRGVTRTRAAGSSWGWETEGERCVPDSGVDAVLGHWGALPAPAWDLRAGCQPPTRTRSALGNWQSWPGFRELLMSAAASPSSCCLSRSSGRHPRRPHGPDRSAVFEPVENEDVDSRQAYGVGRDMQPPSSRCRATDQTPEGLQVWANPLESIMAKRCVWRSLEGWKTPQEKENACRRQKEGERTGQGQRFSPALDAPCPLGTHAQGIQGSRTRS